MTLRPFSDAGSYGHQALPQHFKGRRESGGGDDSGSGGGGGDDGDGDGGQD